MEFDVPEASVTSLIGRNGMGKTTTIHTILGMVRARSGEITFKDRNIATLSANAIARKGIGLVPEGRRVFRSLSIEENLRATARNGGPWDLARIHSIFPRLKERRTQLSGTLSGGEQQMLAIGRALMTNPSLLILDEATEGLAPVIRADIWATLKDLKAMGQSILLVDKNLKEMADLVDRHHIVEKGQVIWAGSPEDLSANTEFAQRTLGV